MFARAQLDWGANVNLGRNCLVALGLAVVATSNVETTRAATLADTAQVIVTSLASAPECAGAAVAIAFSGKAGAGQVFSGTVSYASGVRRPADANTIFYLGSVTKTFTAFLLAEAVAQRLVKPEDPAINYLPNGTMLPSFQQGGRNFPVRLIDLATHTSGLPRDLPDMTYPFSTAQMYAGLAKISLASQPGTAWSYSNLGFALLAEAMQGVFKASYDKLLADNIAIPLGMAHTRLVSDTSDGAEIPIGYGPKGGKAPLNNSTWPAFNGAGAIRASLTDMSKYLSFAMTGSGNGHLAQLRPILFDWHSFARQEGGGNIEQGLAWQRETPFGNGVDVVWKDGEVPGFAAFIAYSEKLGEGAVVLSNRQTCKVGRAALCVLRAAGELNGTRATRGPSCAF